MFLIPAFGKPEWRGLTGKYLPIFLCRARANTYFRVPFCIKMLILDARDIPVFGCQPRYPEQLHASLQRHSL
jgi:hypothetical protein